MPDRRLESHHIAGENNSEITTTLCVESHINITTRQMSWDTRWTDEANSENLRASFILQGIQELFVELHYQTGVKDYRSLADSLSSLVRSYRDRG